MHALNSATEATSGTSAVAAASLRLLTGLTMERAYRDDDAGRKDPVRTGIDRSVRVRCDCAVPARRRERWGGRRASDRTAIRVRISIENQRQIHAQNGGKSTRDYAANPRVGLRQIHA